MLGLLNPNPSTYHYLSISNGLGKGKVIEWNETGVSRQVSTEKKTYNVGAVSLVSLRLYSL